MEKTYFRDIYSGVNEKWYRQLWKEFDQLKNIDQKYHSQDYYDTSVNKYGGKCGTSLNLWENKGWIFQWYFRYWLGRRSLDDERQINRWKKIVGRFKGKLFKMIKDVGGKLDDYSISPEIGQILLHWGY